MSLYDFVLPVNKQHSIKEAVITIFLSSRIDSPQSFEGLIRNEFKEIFNLFEKVGAWVLTVNKSTEKGGPDYSQDENAGFRFIKNDTGKTTRVLQGINEVNRTFISFHTLDYVRWVPFFSEFLICIDAISQKHQEFQIEAFNLHYIDEFTWISGENPNLRLIFNDKNEFIPTSFLDSYLPRLDLFFTTNRSDENEGTIYYDRINIAVLPTIQPIIQINHTVTHQLNNPINIKDLLSRNLFKDLIESAHSHNKEVLKKLLTSETAQMINLP